MFKQCHLTLLVGPVAPVPAPQSVIDALTEVQVMSGADTASGFQLSFTLSQRSPLHALFVLGAAAFPVLRVILIATIGGGAETLIDGVVTRTDMVPANGSAPGTLTVTGEDLSRLMDYIDLSGVPYPGMPPHARVALILARYAGFGVVPLIVPSPFSDIRMPPEYESHQGTDLDYLRQLAAEAGFVFYLEPGPVPGTSIAYWGPEIKAGFPQPALSADMDVTRNIESLSFSCDVTKKTMPVVFIQNAQTKLPIPIPVPEISLLQPPLGAFVPPPRSVTFLRDTAKASPMRAISLGLSSAARSADVVSASGSLDATRYGRLLKPRRLVGVRGAGFAHDGLYYVKSVTTTLKRGELKQSFSLSRNALVSNLPALPL